MDLNKTKLYGKAKENVLHEWYYTGLRETIRIDVEKQRNSRPKFFFVKSQLFKAMKAIASDTNTPNGRMWVLCGRPMSGKTSAGRVLLEHAGRAFQIKRGLFVSKPADISLVKAVSKHIGAPDTGDLERSLTLLPAQKARRLSMVCGALRWHHFAAVASLLPTRRQLRVF
jgi:hypothetical protein